MAILIKDNIEINSNQPGSNGGIIAKTVIQIFNSIYFLT